MENNILKKYIAVDLEFAFSRIIENLEFESSVKFKKKGGYIKNKN